MLEISVNPIQSTRSSAAEDAGKFAVTPNQAFNAGNLGATLEAQIVLPKVKQSIESMSLNQLDRYVSQAFSFNPQDQLEAAQGLAVYLLDRTNLTKTDMHAMMNLVMASVASQPAQQSHLTKDDELKELVSFSPSAWQAHIDVFLSVLATYNLARKTNAEMNGMFTQMAFQAAEAKGVAIVEAGKAEMYAAVAGAVLSTALTTVGAGMSIKGHQGRNADIKKNLRVEETRRLEAETARVDMDKAPFDFNAPGTSEVRGEHSDGLHKTVEVHNGDPKLDTKSKAHLEQDMRVAIKDANNLRLTSQEAQLTFDTLITKGNTMSALGAIVAQALSSFMRQSVYEENQRQTLQEAAQGVHTATKDMFAQDLAQISALIAKIMDLALQAANKRGELIGFTAKA